MQINRESLGFMQRLSWLLLIFPFLLARAQEDFSQQLLRQQERERNLRNQQEVEINERLAVDKYSHSLVIPSTESPCFAISRIDLVGEQAHQFVWALQAANSKDDYVLGRCLGATGINVVMSRIQNAIIERGFITTRIFVTEQDLTTGVLAFTLLPGVIRNINFSADTSLRARSWNAVLIQSGDLLNLRELEQMLENFKRVPTVSADIQIVPAEKEGESDVVINWQQRRLPLRVSLSLDDSGSKATGKLQGNLTLSLDNMFLGNDLFYVNRNHDLFNPSDKGTEGYTSHYSIPYGFWLISANFSNYKYYQTVSGLNQDYVYSGKSDNTELRLSRLIYRDAVRKTSVYWRSWLRKSSNFIDDTEIVVQRRRTAGWEGGTNHHAYINNSIVDVNLAYKRGTGAFKSQSAPEEAFGEGTSRMQLITADINLSTALSFGRYVSNLRRQWNRSSLIPQDRFSIGGRYSVRGFDGELSLLSERGILWRNELGFNLNHGQELYSAVDYGRVSGKSSTRLSGRSLSGAVLGLRGGLSYFYWDLFVGTSLHKPKRFNQANSLVTGFTVNWIY